MHVPSVGLGVHVRVCVCACESVCVPAVAAEFLRVCAGATWTKKSVNGLDAGHEKLKKGNRQWGLRQREGLIKIHAIF